MRNLYFVGGPVMAGGGTTCGATDGPRGTIYGAMDGPEGLSVAAAHSPGGPLIGGTIRSMTGLWALGWLLHTPTFYGPLGEKHTGWNENETSCVVEIY